jgi:exopolysaccharide production protein ExoZ
VSPLLLKDGMQHHKLQSIQILRGVAAIFVVISHLCTQMRDSHPMACFLGVFANLGGIGVDIFFVISGFIMVVTTFGRADGPGASFNFLRKRALRIYPVYWVWTTLLLLLWGLKLADQAPSLTPSYVIASYLLWPASNDAGKWMPMINQGWSLSFELYFYLFFAAAIAVKARRSMLLFLLAAFLALFALAQIVRLPPSLDYLFSSPLVFEFLLGVIAGSVYARGRGGENLAAAIVMVFFATIGLLFALFSTLPLPHLLTHGLPAMLLVLGASLLPVRNIRCLSLPIFLGDASYSIYLTHSFLLGVSANLLRKGIGTQIQPDLLIIILTILFVAICAQAYRFVEAPLIAFVSEKRKPNLDRSVVPAR